MRAFLIPVALYAVAGHGAALAQDNPPLIQAPSVASAPAADTTFAPATAGPALAPLPTVAPTVEASAPVVAAAPPPGIDPAPTPELGSGPLTAAPVIVAKEDKNFDVGGKLGVVVGGVAGGAAGAAVGGPVGKFAGGFLARRVLGGVFGDKDKTTELTVTQAAPSAETAGSPAVAQPATAPELAGAAPPEASLTEKVSTEPSAL